MQTVKPSAASSQPPGSSRFLAALGLTTTQRFVTTERTIRCPGPSTDL